ncbi:g7052 [Coccomyxa elongata]
MTDRNCYRGLRPGANPKRPPYDSTKYQRGELASAGSGFDQYSNVDDANGCDFHCTVTLVEQDSVLQGVDADRWRNQMSDRSDVTNITDDKSGATNEPGTVIMNQLSRQQSCSEQPARNTTRLEYFKRRRTQLLSKQSKLKMLQHDLYDTLVKLQALLSEDASLPLEDKAARLTCLVAEVCAIQLQAQEIHDAGRRSTHPKQDPVQPSHKHKPAAQHNSAGLKTNWEAAQDRCLDDSAGRELNVACIGELIMQLLQSSAQTHGIPRRVATGAFKSKDHGKVDMRSSAEMSNAAEDLQPSRPHGKPTRTSQVSPAELQAPWQGQEEQSRDSPAGSRAHATGKAAGKTEEAGSAGLASQPEATLGRWHRCDQEAGDHSTLNRLSSSGHGADKPHMDAKACDGRCDRLLTMLQAELVLHGCHTAGQEPSQPQLLSIPFNARTGVFSGQADTGSPTTRPVQAGYGSILQQLGEAVPSSRPPVRAVQEGAFSPQQLAHGRGSVRGPRQADWDSSISAAVDPDKVVKTRSGLRLRPPTRPAMAAAAARPMSASMRSNRPTTAATVAGSVRPASRLGVSARSQKQGMQPWDEGTRRSRRPDWDDRFTVPKQQPKGQTQVEDIAPVHAFRASTPDRVLKEHLPKRKQQHPWLSKRARQLRGQQAQPRSRRAASVPRPGPEGYGSLPSTSTHSGTAAEPLGSHETQHSGPGSRLQLSSAVNARLNRSAEEMLNHGIWPNGEQLQLPARPQSAVHSQHPGLGLYDDAASQAHVKQTIGSHYAYGAASELGQQDEQGGSLCDRHLKERLEINLLHSEVQGHSSDVQACAANAATGRLGAGSISGGAVSAEPLLAQLEDMEARMKAMMSTIESRLYGIQGCR